MNLLTVLAGVSKDTFTIQEIVFMAAPLTIAEVAEYNALPTVAVTVGGEARERIAEDARCEFWADKLRRRVKGNATDPATITAEWFMEHMESSRLPLLEHLLFYGELPKAGENTKAR